MTVGVTFQATPDAMDYQSSAMTVGLPFVATPDGMDSRFRGNDGGGGFSGLYNDGGFHILRQ